MGKQLTTAQFIAKAQAVHGLRYDYRETVYVNAKTKLNILCPSHGPFTQSPSDHVNSSAGCQKCKADAASIRMKRDINYFLQRSRTSHGDRYDYLLTQYSGNKTKVKIICPAHGLFEQLAGDHMRGFGCKTCADNGPLTTARFIEKAHAKHGERYDYSHVICTNKRSLVTICCSIHGRFEQVASNHLSQKGCPKCSREVDAKAKTRTQKAFIEKAQAKHGARYDYSQVKYVRSSLKVKIGCSVHGFFIQVANDHLMGRGCRRCAQDGLSELSRVSWVERAGGRPCTLYLLRLYTDIESFYKVGITFHSIAERYKSAVALNGYFYEIIAQHCSTDAARVYDWEQSILETFAHLRYKPSRPFGGATECFSSSSCDEILAIFPF